MEAVERGIAYAEAETVVEEIGEMKNLAISRLRDRLQYYESTNGKMLQRNQEVVTFLQVRKTDVPSSEYSLPEDRITGNDKPPNEVFFISGERNLSAECIRDAVKTCDEPHKSAEKSKEKACLITPVEECRSVALMEVLPYDAVVVILDFLSTKVLHRLRCISKPLCPLINYVLQQRRSGVPLIIISRNVYRSNIVDISTYDQYLNLINRFSLVVLPWHPHAMFSTVDSCKGLVYIGSEGGYTVLCDPVKESTILLPEIVGTPCCVGIGHADGKVKVVRYYNIGTRRGCDVFILGTNAWRKALTESPFDVASGHASFLHGAVHILPSWSYDVYDIRHIAAFDLDTVGYTNFPLPSSYFEDFQGRHCTSHLTTLGGDLCVCRSIYDAITYGKVEVWALSDYDVVIWQLCYQIPVASLVSERSSWNGILVDPVAILQDGTVLMTVFGREYELLCYDSRSGAVV